MRWLAIAAIALAGCGAPPDPVAITPAIVSSPGPLIASHANLACTECHLDSSPLLAAGSCVRCHDATVAPPAGGRGLHAQPAVRDQACIDCHKDHRGPRFDTRWSAFGGPARFDHALTGMKLERGHRVACARCHPAATVASRSPSQAASPSHDASSSQTASSSQDASSSQTASSSHDASSSQTASSSHDASSSQTTSSSSTQDASSSQTASSSQRTSASSTARSPYAGASRACVSCHAPPHAGTPYATLACESCHPTADTWTAIAFDHDENTRWTIGASHTKLACATCHTPSLGARPPARACASCHASRDPHAGRFAKIACETCHAPSMSFVPGQAPPAWKPNAFDHRKGTGWALVGTHAEVTCRACHRAPGSDVFVPLGKGTDCAGCHEHRNVHDRKYTNGQCLRCHFYPG
ncbi:MAG: hypothetical protein AB7L94_32735 [Kofleriaceae bacterium]